MKTREMNLAALQDAKEAAFNIQNRIFLFKQELAICGAFLSDSVQENLITKISELEAQYVQTNLLIAHYKKSLGY